MKKDFAEGESPISLHSKVAVKQIEKITNTRKEQIYISISNEQGGFTVWHMNLDNRGDNVESGPTVVLEVERAHNGEVINIMNFITINGEAYLTTGAKFDHRVNFWRI